MNLLNSYESEFKTLYGQTIQSLSHVSLMPLQERNVELRTIEQNKDELLELIDSMDIELNNAITDSIERANYKAKLRGFRVDIQTHIATPLQDFVDSNDRDLLFANANTNLNGIPEEQRNQLLQNHNLLNKSGERLKQASQIANETEQIGSQIMNDLRSQRETLENSRQTLFQADSYIDKSIKTLKTMSRRLIANKFISYAIIAVLILLILLVLFSKFK